MRACKKNKLTVIIRHREAAPTDAARRTEPNEGILVGEQNSLYTKRDGFYRAE